MTSQQLPQGVADLYAQDYEIKQSLIDRLKKLLSSYGCQPIQTPTFEYYDLFMNVPGTMDTDQMIKLVDHDGKVLVLRPDATVPIARMAAQSNSRAPSLNKLFYVTNIFRMESGESDKTSRSFTQVGVECFDDAHPLNDVEIVVLAIELLKETGMDHVQLELGQAGFFKALLQESNLEEDKQQLIQQKVNEKNEYELSRLLQSLQIEEWVKDQLVQLINLFGEPDDVLSKVEDFKMNHGMNQSIKRLTELVNQLKRLGYEQYISVDLGLVNHLNYYTETMFQGYIEGYGKPIIQGGRYDQLTKYFDLKTSAIGFGIYVDDLINIVKMQSRLPIELPKQVTIVTDYETFPEAMRLAYDLRQEGLVVSMAYDQINGENVEILVELPEQTVTIEGDRVHFNSVAELVTKVGWTNGNH
ncbi:ATP phosphoribosyltransferase regulatory subunit [Alkalibacillus silvisoli]|uniref:ATP phosphoribosyltransferase regulatory subunit n=1 Tax=Alkalibacillus silvisoli TaxID=392823 RepID=A0ABN0ZM39_9BACI